MSAGGEEEEDPGSSNISLYSYHSKESPLTFNDKPGLGGMDVTKVQVEVCGQDECRPESSSPSCLSQKSDQSKEIPLAFNKNLDSFNRKEGTRTCCTLCQTVPTDPVCLSCGHSFCSRCVASHCDQLTRDSSCLSCGKRSKRTNPQAERLRDVLDSHKATLKKQCEFAIEGIAEEGHRNRLNKVYTELYITEGQCESVNVQHEVWHLETMSKMETLHETPVKCCDIFKVLPDQRRVVKTVLTNGIAGIGKTFSVQKFALDWAEDQENQDISLVVVLSFRELNLISREKYSLLKLLSDFHPDLHRMTAEMLSRCKVLFIFDGLDESRLFLDFQENEVVSDVTHTSTINMLLVNLIKGNLLPSALLWITSRPAAASQLPSAFIDRLTEVRGFTDSQKEEYFRRRLHQETPSDGVISHIKTSRSLYIMCHIPVFCWITATVLEQMFTTDLHELPTTLTEMYAHFLMVQTKRNAQKYEKGSKLERLEKDKEVILKLGRLAFEHLEKGNIMFYQDDLEKCGLDVTEASVLSGLCTKIFKREHVLFQKTIYCFIHLSIQEFVAAVYLIHCYLNKNTEVLIKFLGDDGIQTLELESFLSRVVDKSVNSGNGHLDLFVRFLHGLILESNNHLLGDLLGWAASSPESIQRAITNLKKMNAYDISPDRSINIFHCLMEMNDHSVHQEIQEYLQLENREQKKLTKTHCSALAYMLQMSEKVIDELDLKKYNASGDGRRRLLPAVRNCLKARLSCCGLSESHCKVISSALMANPSHLRELDLSGNDYLLDSGVQLLTVGLQSSTCRLEILSLKNCSLSEGCCGPLASALLSASCCLKELDLSNNNYIQDSGVKQLSVGLESPHCRLETLRLSCCRLTESCCSCLASSIEANPSHVRVLDLSNNKLKDLGVNLLVAALRRPQCKLKTWRLNRCGLTENCCASLASLLKCETSSLSELELSDNDLQDPGVNLLCEGLESPHCGLETLRLRGCWLSESCCAPLASALRSSSSRLKELDLSENGLQDTGVKLLSGGLESSRCRLDTLRLVCCQVTDEGCVPLASALKSNAILRELDLSKNNIQEQGAKLLTDVQESRHKLDPLSVEGRLLHLIT
nr:NACHT, LRR and PYD domains-containing protein 12 [Nothobranchius furzeri]